MKVGAVFPQTEIGSDPIAVRDWTQAAEDLGFDHLIVYDHVLGADGSHHTNLTGPYRLADMFHEPFVLFGYMAALTQRIELVTAVIIIGQRQTALAAKQAAEVDVLSGGRLRLGLGTGWNHVEYEALSENFNNRGIRSEEQIELMRELWAKDVLDFDGKWHKVTKAGINPRPVQQTIPIWLGGGREAAPGNRGERVLERVGRMADGFFPMWPPDRAGDGLGESKELRQGGWPRSRVHRNRGSGQSRRRAGAVHELEPGVERPGRQPRLHQHHERGPQDRSRPHQCSPRLQGRREGDRVVGRGYSRGRGFTLTPTLFRQGRVGIESPGT